MALASVGLDGFHLLKPNLEEPFDKWEFKKESPDEGFRAYKILEENFKAQGPGLIFTEFTLLSHGHMLSTVAYHINAALNPNFDPRKARWAAVLVNRYYQPFLSRRFPDSKWYRLSPEKTEDGGMVLGIIPQTDQTRGTLAQWKLAHDYFHSLGLEAENILNNKKNYDSAVGRLEDGRPLVQGDPFLESMFGEWLAQYHYGPTLEKNILAIEGAIRNGYPSVHLFYKLAGFYAANGQWGMARLADRKAEESAVKFTNGAVKPNDLNEKEKAAAP